jgi:hypothetical protein
VLMTDTETKWAERVEQWRASGQTAGEFAAGRDFQASTLRYWASELRRIAGGGERRTGGVRMARVVAVRAESPRSPLVVTVGSAQVVVRAGFDRGLLRELVEALSGR